MATAQPHEILVAEGTREIGDWVFQGGDPQRRLAHLGASLFMAIDSARGNYALTEWFGDAAIIMNRMQCRLNAIAPRDAALHHAVYRALALWVLAHPMMKALSGTYA